MSGRLKGRNKSNPKKKSPDNDNKNNYKNSVTGRRIMIDEINNLERWQFVLR